MTEPEIMPDTDITKFERRSPGVVKTSERSVSDIVALCIEKNYSPEFIEKMMILKRQDDLDISKKAHYESIVHFKSKKLELLKDKINKQTGNSPYLSTGKMLAVLNPELADDDLFVDYKLKDSDDYNWMTLTCFLKHKGGYSEETSMTLKVETTGPKGGAVMTDTHARMSALTYLIRGTTTAKLGIAIVDERFDDDGNAAGELEYISEKQLSQIIDMINAKEADETKFLKYIGVESLEKIPADKFNAAMTALKSKKKPARQPGEEG